MSRGEIQSAFLSQAHQSASVSLTQVRPSRRRGVLPYRKRPDPVLTFLLREVGLSPNTFLAVFVQRERSGRHSYGPLGDIRTALSPSR